MYYITCFDNVQKDKQSSSVFLPCYIHNILFLRDQKQPLRSPFLWINRSESSLSKNWEYLGNNSPIAHDVSEGRAHFLVCMTYFSICICQKYRFNLLFRVPFLWENVFKSLPCHSCTWCHIFLRNFSWLASFDFLLKRAKNIACLAVQDIPDRTDVVKWCLVGSSF